VKRLRLTEIKFDGFLSTQRECSEFWRSTTWLCLDGDCDMAAAANLLINLIILQNTPLYMAATMTSRLMRDYRLQQTTTVLL